MTADELHTFDRLCAWFLWTWLGQGHYVPRPRMTLEQALRLIRVAHRDHYPDRRPMREHELALAWVADTLHEEPRRLPARTRLSTGHEVDVTLWADIGSGRRIAFGLGVAGKDREVLLEPAATWALARQLLSAAGEVRRPEESGVRTDTVIIPVPITTWTDEQDTPDIRERPGSRLYRR